MKVLNKIKSIYLLAIIAILSFCMLLFPAMPKTASADNTMGTGDIQITGIEVSVQTVTDENTSESYDKWAVMFRASITQEAFNSITNEGTADVKFGILVGLTSRAEGISELGLADIIASKAEGGRSFQFFTYSASQIVFNEGVAEIWGGIVYNENALTAGNQNLIATANKSLTAIPFYMVGDVSVDEGVKSINATEYDILFDSQKNAIPRNYLAASYVSPNPESINPVKEETVNAFAGGIVESEDEAYICRSTNRVMVPKKVADDEGTLVADGTLIPANLAVNNSQSLVIFGEEKTPILVNGGATSEDVDLLDEKVVETLEKYGTGVLITFGDQIVAYNNAKVAERVITRFADRELTEAEDENTPQDYLAKAVVTDEETNAGYFQSIFAVQNGANNLYTYPAAGSSEYTFTSMYSTAVVYQTMDKGYNGLYVLGNHISFAGEYKVYTGTAFSGSMKEGSNYIATSFANPIYGLGFGGEFDGRGLSIDANEKANHGIFPSAFDATVKNTAFLGLTQTVEGGGIMAHARASRFENIYAVVASVTSGKADFNKGILMNVQDCDFVNFIANVDLFKETAGSYTTKLSVPNGTDAASKSNSNTARGWGQGILTGGVFSFRGYNNMFYDETIKDSQGKTVGGVRYLYKAVAGDSLIQAMKGLYSISKIEELFPDMITMSYDEETGNNYKSLSTYIGTFGTQSVNNAAPMQGSENTGSRLHTEVGTAFVGSTGENVYAIGSSPLYISHYNPENTNNGISNVANATNGTNLTTVFVNENEVPDLADGSGKAKLSWVYDAEAGTVSGATSYVWNQIGGETLSLSGKQVKIGSSNYISFADENGNFTLGEKILLGKWQRLAKTKLFSTLGITAKFDGGGTTLNNTNVLQAINYKNPAELYKIQFVNQAGFYDYASVNEMTQNISAENVELFTKTGFWKVDTATGAIAWANLANA